jgi:hypothetical protein
MAEIDAFLQPGSWSMSSTRNSRNLPARFAAGSGGITSICSAHPWSIEAALGGAATGTAVLIEATCNQVNQDGGYTGMTPADFRRFRARTSPPASASTRRASFWAATISVPIRGSICRPTRPWQGRRHDRAFVAPASPRSTSTARWAARRAGARCPTP